MRQNYWVKLIIVFLCTFSFTAFGGKSKSKSASTKPVTLKKVREKESQSDYLPNTIVIKFKNRVTFGEKTVATGLASVDGLLERFHAKEMEQFLKESAIGSHIVRETGLESIYFVNFDSGESPVNVARAFSRNSHIEYAEPRYVRYIYDTPNDPEFINMPQFARVLADQAWDVVKGETGDVVIAIVDGGTDWDHEDLIDNVWTNPGEIPDNGIDDDGNLYIDDVRGWNFANGSNDPTGLASTPGNRNHGTHTAGTAVGRTNNNTGVASISWNCSLMSINAGSENIDRVILHGYSGIAYAALMGADIISCSWGGGGFSAFEQDVIDFAYDNGALVIAAAGNDGTNNDNQQQYPAGYNRVLSVGSTQNSSDIKSGFSNYGASVHVFAPGSNILSTFHGNGYGRLSGTSMSTPMAAGLAGLIKTLRPGFSVDELREQIRVTSDPIDNVNPGFSGRLGKGRINALRAVTEFSSPAIRVSDLDFTDSGGDGNIDGGDVVDLSIDFINYLEDAANVTIELTTTDPNVNITNSTLTLGALARNEVQNGAFRFVVFGSAPVGHLLLFTLETSADNYSDRELLSFTVSPPQVLEHFTGTIESSVTDEGNIGFTDGGGPLGVGFVHNEANYLFEGGLLIANASNRVSDCVRDENENQKTDITLAVGENLTIASPGQRANEEGSVLMTDSAATNPLGVSILQKTHADNSPEYQNFILYQYTVFNNNATDLSNVYVGQFFDWDINTSANDYARYDVDRNTAYVMDDLANPTRIAAVRLLSNNSNLNYHAIHNPEEIYDGFTDTEKWNLMSGGIQTLDLDNIDISTIMAEGPLTIPANSSVDVVFALIGANSIAELETNSDNANLFWNGPVAIEDSENPLVREFQLQQNFPNPFNPTTTIRYAVPKTTEVTLEIFNTLGQKIRTLVNGHQAAGVYETVWDGKNDTGIRVTGGIYLYRLKAENVVLTRKLALVK